MSCLVWPSFTQIAISVEKKSDESIWSLSQKALILSEAYLTVKPVTFGDLKEDKAASNGHILNCSVTHSYLLSGSCQ